MKILIRLLLGTLVFVGALAYFAPASIIEKFMPSHISVSGMTGTLWKGHLQRVAVNKFALQNIQWSANPWGLLLGKLQADISIHSEELKGDFSTTYTISSILAENVLLDGELSLLNPYLERYGVTLQGQFGANFDELHIKNNLPKSVIGTLQTFDARIRGIVPLELGNIKSQFSKQPDDTQINLDNQNGDLDIEGVLNVSTDGSYRSDITLSKNVRTPENLLQTIRMVGNEVEEGRFRLQYEGQLSETVN